MFKKFADFLGFEHIESFYNQRDIRDLLHNNRSDLSKYLPYEYWHPGYNILSSKDYVFASVLKATPIASLSSGEIFTSSMREYIASVMPKNAMIQILLVGHPRISSILQEWQASKHYDKLTQEQASILNNLVNRRTEFFYNIAEKPYNANGTQAINFDLYIIFVEKQSDDNISVLNNFQEGLQNLQKKLEQEKIYSNVCNIETIISLSRLLLSGDQRSRNIEPVIYNKYRPLTDHFIDIDSLAVESSKIYNENNNIVSRSFRLKGLPDQLDLYNIFYFIGDALSPSSYCPCNFVINYTILNNSNNTIKENLRQQGEKEIKYSESFEHRNNLQLQKSAAEWKYIITELNNSEILEEYFSVTISTDNKFIDYASEKMQSIFRSIGWDLRPGNCLHLEMQLANLPMVLFYFWQDFKLLKLVHHTRDLEAIMKFPIAAEIKPPNNGGMLFTGRKGQLFTLDFFGKDLGNTNYNICVIAPSGAGKSVFLQDLALSQLSQDTQVFILDIGDSYRNLAKIFKGDYFKFEYSNEYSLDPLYGLNNSKKGTEIYEDNFNYAKTILLSMCVEKISKTTDGVMSKALNDAISKYNKVSLQNIHEILSEDKFDGMKMAKALYPYIDENNYGKYFNSSSKSMNFNNKLTVIELGKIQNNPALLSVIVQIIINQITTKFLLADKPQKFMIILDEGWTYMGNPLFSHNIGSLTRTVRKRHGSIVICQQSLKDFYQNEGCITSIENSSWTIFLKQKSTDYMKQHESYKNFVPLADSLRMVKGVYSELLILLENIPIVARLVLDPFSKALYATEAENFAFVNQQLKENREITEIIEELSKKYE